MKTAAIGLSLLLVAGDARAQSGQNVLVVANEMSGGSVQVANHYARRHSLAADQVLLVRAPVQDEIDRRAYQRQIEAPIANWLAAHAAQDRILYIVLTKDVPLRITGTAGRTGTVASVDSELTLLYRRMLGIPVAVPGALPNPYFGGAAPGGTLKRFTHEVADIYLVTRLDAFTVAEALALVDRAAAPAKEGEIVLDQKGTGLDKTGDRWLEQAAEALRARGFERVSLDRTTDVVTGKANVLGYYSWGSNDPSFRQRRIGFSFVPGAIAGMFVSTDARTFREPPADWTIGDWKKPGSFYAGSPQALTGDLVREGVTGVAGHVAEPDLGGTVRPFLLFPAYVSGLNLAESFYVAMPYLSWQNVVVGDPLCAPFRSAPIPSQEIDKGLDPATELPALFSTRRMAVLVKSGVRPDAATHLLKGDAKLAAGDHAGARAAFEAALKADPTQIDVERRIPMIDDQQGRYEQAVEGYQRLLKRAPNDVASLNNLAYILAARLNRPKDALEPAERAQRLAPRAGSVVDTVAWIRHLTGEDQKAALLIDDAVKLEPDDAELRVHAAAIYAALGNEAVADRHLGEAVRLAPALATREDVRNLRAQLRKK
jgi:uncharacterized protein (TIGR03790 family)